jgi:F-box protein 11
MTATLSNWQGTDLAGGRYRVTSRIPGGGMAEVYRAWDRNLQTEVIIKVPLAELLHHPAFAARFSREVRSLVRLAHPHIVKVLDVGEQAGVPFAVLQFLAGGSLRHRQLAQSGGLQPLPAGTLADWLGGIAEALDFLHAQNYIHRDVKPGNILFDGHGNAYLGDFGIIKAVAGEGATEMRANLTQRGMILGTLQYMAPEVFLSQPYDGRVDQYALAVTVYEALTGRCPFQGADQSAIMTQHLNVRPPDLRALLPGIPPALSQAVARGMARDPGQRFPQCQAFADAVLKSLAGPQPVSSPAAPKPHMPGAAPATPVTPNQAVQLPCPMCQEIVVVTSAHRGQRIACANCQADLGVSTDLRSLSAGTECDQPAAFDAPPSEELPAPMTFELPVQTQAVVGPITFDLAVEENLVGPPTQTPLPEIRLESGPPVPSFQVEAPRASAPNFLPPEPVSWPAEQPRRSKGPKVFLLVTLCLLLVGGLGLGTFYALRVFRDKDPEKDKKQVVASVKTQSAPAPAKEVEKPKETKKTKEAKEPEPEPRPDRSNLVVSAKGQGKYTTLSQALKAAKAYATIRVLPGVYAESLTLDKPVTLVGDGPRDQIVIQGAAGPSVRVQAEAGGLRNLTLRTANDAVGAAALEITQGSFQVEDCDLSSQGGSALAIFGARSKPLLRRCKVHDCRGPGVLVHTSARPTLDACEIYANGLAGVEVRQDANPTLRKCTVRDGNAAGFLIHQDAQATLEDCIISGNSAAGVLVKERGQPTLKGCKVHSGLAQGLQLTARGQAIVEDCEFYGNGQVGVLVEGHSEVTLRECRIHDGKKGGVSVRTESQVQLEDCKIYANAGPGLWALSGSKPLVHRCTFRDGQQFGIRVDGCAGTLEDCTLTGHAWAGLVLSDGCTTLVRKCTVRDGKDSGIVVENKAEPKLKECLVFANAKNGLEVRGGADPTVQECKFYECKNYGVLMEVGAKGTLEDCDIYGHVHQGVVAMTDSAPVLRKCRIKANKGEGVWVDRKAKGLFASCTIFQNGYSGVVVQTGGQPTLQDCDIYENTWGLWIKAAGAQVKSCKVHDNKNGGLLFEDRADVTVEGSSVSRNTDTGIVVRLAAKATIRRCDIFDGKSSGVMFSKSEGTVADCQVYGNTLAGLYFCEGANPRVQNCTLYNGKSSGISVTGEGTTGTIEDCELYGNALAGVIVYQGGAPVVRRCKMHDGVQGGIYVLNGGKGLYEDCTLYNNTLAQIEVNKDSNPTFVKCTVRNGKASGVFVHDGASGTLTGCEIFGNRLGGVLISKAGNPLLKECKIHSGVEGGVFVFEKGKGVLEDCRIYSNTLSGVETKLKGRVTLRHCTITGNRGSGIYAHEKGYGTVIDCDLRNNGNRPFSVEKGSKLMGRGNKT